ncbi:hypothetical protein CONCODRAFT_80775, partial [Conidiobolus coronatus NRRL 28638]
MNTKKEINETSNREKRRQIAIENVVILLILVYFAYSYYTNSLFNDSVRVTKRESCRDVCFEKHSECGRICDNRLRKCSYYYYNENYDKNKDIECDDIFDNSSLISCVKSCSDKFKLCFGSCQ